ncbi:hypothetical protein [Streptomyces profundus]|uniref:hypothetical protein n=1 Tax=Streptomyces profundus TaxID=2867410 RepID=UPI001D16985E|nr:hypothetical protein [Streptomyces sp. MA3_2.13]UED84508.1 hypothetical protein K4G22_10080 [Streptomyces sp. MA3_2.13]
MGRAESALAQHHPVTALAQWLESLRQRSGMSWSQLALTVEKLTTGRDEGAGSPISRSTLFRAARGVGPPRWETVRAFTRACGGDEREAKRRWAAADRHRAARAAPEPAVGVPGPRFLTEPWQLVRAMVLTRREHGNPTLRELEDRARVHGVSLLPHSTLGAVLRGRMPGKTLLLAFFRYCGGASDSQLAEWADAWDRVRALEGARARQTVPLPGRPGPLTVRPRAGVAHRPRPRIAARAD